jgi:hypothetical protein
MREVTRTAGPHGRNRVQMGPDAGVHTEYGSNPHVVTLHPNESTPRERDDGGCEEEEKMLECPCDTPYPRHTRRHRVEQVENDV